jgi:signal transduction histidine kinase
MSFKDYIKEKLPVLFINIIIFAFIIFLFYLYNVNLILILLICVLWLMPIITFIASDFLKKRKYYTNILSQLNALDKKYLITELTQEPSFLEGKILYHVLKDTNKCMHENINSYKYLQQEYREYIETWVHEVKTPISSSKLVVENNKNEITLSILEELVKIEEFIEQALYYSRSNTTEEDYIVREFDLKTIINDVIKKNSKYFIQKRISLEMDDFNDTLFSDIKWVHFILNQIIINALNYSKSDNPMIKICAKKNDNNITLYIEDNGVGISEKDLPMVFNKGFTGNNGRVNKRSTGMGLYLCKKLCGKLGLAIEITSVINMGTTVKVIFPKSKMMLLE